MKLPDNEHFEFLHRPGWETVYVAFNSYEGEALTVEQLRQASVDFANAASELQEYVQKRELRGKG